MAYDFFPENESQIIDKLKRAPADKTGDVIALFKYLKKAFPAVKAPINLDLAKLSMVNVTRGIEQDTSVSDIKRNSGIKAFNIKFGNGSSGNRGKNNRGNLFEPQFADALLKWWNGEQVNDSAMLAAIEDLDKTYDLGSESSMKIDVVGGENTKRPLSYTPKIEITNPKGSGTDIGAAVTDITLTTPNKTIYLSLKLGTTVTFFNVGVRTVLTPDEIKAYNITNPDGIKLMKLFGLDEKLFCDVFNDQLKSGQRVNARIDRSAMSHLLKTGIGEGYHIIHKLSGKILSKKMDAAALNKASSVTSATIFYGGKTGTGKRVDIEMESQTYKFKLNLRDTQGKDGYPTRLMCDFSYK